MVAAHAAGDTELVERIRWHLVAEGAADAVEAANIDAVADPALPAEHVVDTSGGGV